MTGAISPRGAFIAPGMAVAAAAKSAPIALDKTIIHGLIDAPSTTRDRGRVKTLKSQQGGELFSLLPYF
jgi:hypothetical protein